MRKMKAEYKILTQLKTECLKHGGASTKPADMLGKLDLGISKNLVYFYELAAIQDANITNNVMIADSSYVVTVFVMQDDF